MSLFRRNRKTDDGYVPGLTPRSLIATILVMLLAAMYLQYSMVILGECYLIHESAIPIPAMLVLIWLLILVGVIGTLFKIRLLTKAEIVCVAFAAMISIPLVTQGFWHRFLGITSAPFRNASYDYLDALNDKLWPHGPNLLEDSFENKAEGAEVSGNGTVTWSEVEYEEGKLAVLPTITNTNASDETFISFNIPVGEDSDAVPSYPHLATILSRMTDTEAETQIFMRALSDDSPVTTLLFTGKKLNKKTFLHKTGFVRTGKYAVVPGPGCQSNLVVQIGLQGRGSAIFADPKLMSVFAMESAFTGRKMIRESDYYALPVSERPSGVVIKPDNLWSLKGVAYYLKGYIPMGEWARPLAVWGAYVLILTIAFFAVNVMMRRKWAESERYPMPNSKIPLALIGANDAVDKPFSSIWRNRALWFGFAFALVYTIMKGMHAYNSNFPSMTMRFSLFDYISNPLYGSMFKVEFVFSLFVCSIAVFFELNILLSLVVGYWIYRFYLCIGHVTGIDINADFPWEQQACIGGYIGYFLVVIALSWKYIWGILKDAAKGKERAPGEVLSSRGALMLFILCHVAIAGWAVYTELNVGSILLLFCFMVLLGFVSAKYRAECGSPFTYFTPYNAMYFIGICGGMMAFGASSMIVAMILSGFLTGVLFYIIPGLQFEAIEVGRRMKIVPRHIGYACLIGVVGGIVIGGWVFLSNAYSYGGDNIKFQWAFNGLNWFMNGFRNTLNETTGNWLRQSADPSAALGPNWGERAMWFMGGLMVVVTILRQFFSGFWLHPIGLLMATSHLDEGANWGTLLVAYLIRLTVLKVGGARAVREKMQPFFLGVFVGCIAGIATFTVINAVSAASGSQLFYGWYP